MASDAGLLLLSSGVIIHSSVSMMTDNALVCHERRLVLLLLRFCQGFPKIVLLDEVVVLTPVVMDVPGMADLMGTFLIKS